MIEPYWLHRESKQVVNYLEDAHEKWGSFSSSPFRQAWVRNYVAYYSPVINPGSCDTSLIFEGVQGELTRFYTPKARTYMRQLVGVITKQRLAFQAMCMTDGRDIVEDVKLANALADQITQNERLDIKADQLVEGALVCGIWFTKTVWRTDKGNPYTRDQSGQLIFTGGVEITCPGVFDVTYDITYPHWDLVPWVDCRTIKNRWDLIAQHPDLEREIMALPSVRETKGPNSWFDQTMSDDDLVFVYEFFARPCPSLPKGRMVVYADSKTVFYDDENPYGTLPVEPMCPETVLGTGLGYPQFTNILAPQEMFDNSLSAIATNQSQFAVQSIAVARGSNVSVQELNGMRFVSFTPQNVPGGGKPEPLQLTQSSPETFKFSDVLDKMMQDMSVGNGALQGNLPPGVSSGVAIATLSANALEFIEPIAKPFRICLEKTLHHAINAYAKFAKIPQMLEMRGQNNKVSQVKFTGDQLENISGIKILTANPLMQTTSGRLEIAEKLMAMPKDLWPKYVSILEGRPLSDVYKNALSQEDLIQSENEDLMAGQSVPVLITDDHPVHIQDHSSLLNDPAVRRNAQSLQNILDHILEHEAQGQKLQMENPTLLAMLRTGKMPEAPQLPPPPPGALPSSGGPLAERSPGPAQPAPDALNRGL